MRGKAKSALSYTMVLGSPPPMRGKDINHCVYLISLGITPAHAGKRRKFLPEVVTHEDHPRPCGEKRAPHQHGHGLGGSPPPMRGKAQSAKPSKPPNRITPAHAGKSARDLPPLLFVEDHPRPCGEKAVSRRIYPCSAGSPPPMRGKVKDVRAGLCRAGITPAHAGKSRAGFCRTVDVEDHPRPCGEKISARLYFTPRSGSPPPMRGKVVFWLNVRTYIRITPAHAGKRFARLCP